MALSEASYNKIENNMNNNLGKLINAQYYVYNNIDPSLNSVLSPPSGYSSFDPTMTPTPIGFQLDSFSNIENFDTTDIDGKYKQIHSLRNELDTKLRELYKLDNSIAFEDKVRFDTTMYSGLLWTVLATSLVYYTFVHM